MVAEVSEHQQPIPFVWTEDEVFAPANDYWLRKAREQYAIGERVALVPHFERSSESHRHMFATLRELWLNLPESLADEYPNPEALRKKALIACGYADRESLVCNSRAEALRVAAFIARGDPYAIVKVEGATVMKWSAQSMSGRAMDRKKFHEAKSAILDWAADLVGVRKEDVKEAP